MRMTPPEHCKICSECIVPSIGRSFARVVFKHYNHTHKHTIYPSKHVVVCQNASDSPEQRQHNTGMCVWNFRAKSTRASVLECIRHIWLILLSAFSRCSSTPANRTRISTRDSASRQKCAHSDQTCHTQVIHTTGARERHSSGLDADANDMHAPCIAHETRRVGRLSSRARAHFMGWVLHTLIDSQPLLSHANTHDIVCAPRSSQHSSLTTTSSLSSSTSSRLVARLVGRHTSGTSSRDLARNLAYTRQNTSE